MCDPEKRTDSQRWASSDLRPGSAFHEIMAVPTLLPAAARPYEMSGVRPGTSGLDKLPWAQPLLRGMREHYGTNTVLSEFFLAYARFNLGYTQDEPTQTPTEHVPVSATTPEPERPIATDSPVVGEPPVVAPSRIRFIEPILVSSRPTQEAPPRFGYSPAPATPAPSDPQSTQDTASAEGIFKGHLVVCHG